MFGYHLSTRLSNIDEVTEWEKGSSAPPQMPPSPMQEARAQMMLEDARAEREARALREQQAREEAEYAKKLQKAMAAQGTAYNTAMDYGNQQVAGRGYDPTLVDQYNLLDLYTNEINRNRQSLAEDDLNPIAGLNMNTAFGNALDTALGAYRGKQRNAINMAAPDSFEYTMFADNADDDILRSILDTQREDAFAQIESAYKRGQLNDTGYSRALKGLDDQFDTGFADLQDLGLGVLSGYRDTLRTMRDNELTKVGNLDFSTTYDPTSFSNRLTQRQTDLMAALRGDVLRATSGQEFFDPSTLITKGGTIQGFYNPTSQNTTGTSNPLLDPLSQNKPQNTPNTNTVF